MEHERGRWMVRQPRRQRDRSPPSVNQGQRRSPSPRAFEYCMLGSARTIRTARKSVPLRLVYGPQPRPETPPHSEMDESGHPLVYESEEDPSEADSGDRSSRAEPVYVPYDLQLDEELAEYIWGRLRRARRVYPDPSDHYLSFLDSIETLYGRRHLLEIDLPEQVWVFTTMSFFPDTAFWNRKKISIVEEGPNQDFPEFLDHIFEYTAKYMYEEE